MGRIKDKIKPFLQNAYVALYTTLHKRDRRIILIGAWMGDKFSDNSRFLFQYLSANKDKLGLTRVIWVTRNYSLNEILNSLGYESYLIGTPESKKWHLKAGVHILCNMAFPQANILPDIDTKYSWGAVKFQLWHGVGMKSVGAASNDAKFRNIQAQSRFHNTKLATWCTLGGWNDEYFLSTSPQNAEVNYAISKCKKDHLFISAYPRNCKCVQLLPDEIEIINKIGNNKRVIGYFPTFRGDNTSNYIHPLSNPMFCQYLKDNDILWIEKRHSADRSNQKFAMDENFLLLDKNFDLNVLYNGFDLIISDYSSVVFDCAYKNIPVIMFCPDLEEFKNGDVGFLFDIESYCAGIVTHSIEECCRLINACFNNCFFTGVVNDTYQRIRRDFFDDRASDYYSIWQDMCQIIQK